MQATVILSQSGSTGSGVPPSAPGTASWRSLFLESAPKSALLSQKGKEITRAEASCTDAAAAALRSSSFEDKQQPPEQGASTPSSSLPPRITLRLKRTALAVGLLTGVAVVAAAVCRTGCPAWDAQSAYLTILSWSCFFWNGARVFTYLPSIQLLLRPGASAMHHSLASWVCWTLSNATTALYLYEKDNGAIGMLVLLNAGNTVMCAVTLLLIWRLRRSERREDPSLQTKTAT